MSAWIIWLVIGLGLLVAEMMSMTFMLVFFGVGALCSSVLAFLGVESLAIQVMTCALVGISGLVVFRKKVLSSLRADGNSSGNDMLDEKITLSKDIPARSQASISYRGVPWTALNQTEGDLCKGDLVRVVRVEGVKLVVER